MSARFSRAIYFGMIPITLAATLLAIAPQVVPAALALVFGLVFVFLYPGFLVEQIIYLYPGQASLIRVPYFFVSSLAVWAILATALQLIGANWLAFRIVFIVILWALTLGALVRRRHTAGVSPTLHYDEIWIEAALGVACVLVALMVARGARDADDWMYLQITQQILGSNSFQILAASEARYSVRYAFHVWIFLQAFLGQWLNADLVTLLRDWLPTLLAPLALISFYAWAKTFFGRARAALLAVGVQLVIYLTFANGDGWGRGFFARSAQDKFLVWLIILPIALTFAWTWLRDGTFANWFGFAAAMIAGLWVHPVTIFLVVLTLGGFAVFNLISRDSFSRRRWAGLVIASVPVLLTPLVIRATTLPAVFRVNTPDVAAYLRLSDGRLLFQPPFYITDPALIAHPLILVSLVLLVLYAPRVFHDLRAQFLWGSTLVPLALLVNPITMWVLGQLFTPWQLWRFTWNLPAAFMITAVLLELPTLLRSRQARAAWTPLRAGSLVVGIVAALWLSNLNLFRSTNTLFKDHSFDPPVEATLRTLQHTLTKPAMVLLPRDLTRYASAYTYNAVVMSNDAQKEEDARGRQIDRFYDKKADPKFLEAFLQFWKIEYAVVPNGSLQDKFLGRRANTQELYKNTELTLYQTK